MVFAPFIYTYIFFVFFFFFFHPSFAVIINHGYFSVSQWNTSRRYLTLQA